MSGDLFTETPAFLSAVADFSALMEEFGQGFGPEAKPWALTNGPAVELLYLIRYEWGRDVDLLVNEAATIDFPGTFIAHSLNHGFTTVPEQKRTLVHRKTGIAFRLQTALEPWEKHMLSRAEEWNNGATRLPLVAFEDCAILFSQSAVQAPAASQKNALLEVASKMLAQFSWAQRRRIRAALRAPELCDVSALVNSIFARFPARKPMTSIPVSNTGTARDRGRRNENLAALL